MPDRFADHPRAKAFFGALLETLGPDADMDLQEDEIVAEAVHIAQAVENAVLTFSINPSSIEAEIRRALLPRYFDFFGGLDRATELIERIITIVRAGGIQGRP